MNLGKIEHDILKLKVNPTEIKENTFFSFIKKRCQVLLKIYLYFGGVFQQAIYFGLDFKQTIYMVYLKGQSKYKLFLSEM